MSMEDRQEFLASQSFNQLGNNSRVRRKQKDANIHKYNTKTDAGVLNMKGNYVSLIGDEVSHRNKREEENSKIPDGGNSVDHMGSQAENIVMNCNSLPADNIAINVSAEEDQKSYNSHTMLRDTGDQVPMDEFSEEDDSDWEPVAERSEKFLWFCMNCTLPNSDPLEMCHLCGEARGFDVLHPGNLSLQYIPVEESSKLVRVASQEEESFESSKQKTAVGFDERMLLHSENKPNPHPERPDRLTAILSSLKCAGLFPGKCLSIPPREVTIEEIVLIHCREHVDAVESTCSMLSSYFTPDTYANEHSALAARLAAGFCVDLASAIMQGEFKNAFALVRPPGHHAGVKDIMGFCLHNNAALAVSACRSAGAKRVLIVDWDVHHGNGTQEIFESDNSVLYISLHRHDGGSFYPCTGAANETGTGKGEGFSVNIPWSRGGVGDNDYLFAFQHAVIPIAKQFNPDFTIISAGFDAAVGDPLGRCEVTPNGFARMTDLLSNLSDGKMLVILEGGYNLRSISACATSVVKVLVGEKPPPLSEDVYPSKVGLKTVLEVLETQLKYWSGIREHYLKLLSLWDAVQTLDDKKVRKQVLCNRGPFWWKWGRKRVIYHNVFFKRKRKQ